MLIDDAKTLHGRAGDITLVHIFDDVQRSWRRDFVAGVRGGYG